MITFLRNERQNRIKIHTKTHDLKKILGGGGHAPNSLAERMASPKQHVNFQI